MKCYMLYYLKEEYMKKTLMDQYGHLWLKKLIDNLVLIFKNIIIVFLCSNKWNLIKNKRK